MIKTNGTQNTPKHIMLIAGETSGDVLGADLLQQLKLFYPDAHFSGVLGPLMLAELAEKNAESLFEMSDLSVMGIAEVLPSLVTILKRIKQVKSYIKSTQPDLVITIDAPDFNFRVVKAVRSDCPNTKFIHYVAPTVWAWRPKRAEKIARLYDALLCLLPFEPPYFEKHGLKATYVGHPAYQNVMKQNDITQVQDDKKSIITILFGSRKGEFQRHSDILIDVMQGLKQNNPDTIFLIPAVDHLRDVIQKKLHAVGFNQDKVRDYDLISSQERYQAYQRSDYAVAVSGTVGLELALSETPHCICYRMGDFTALIARRLIKTPFAHLANIILQREFVPEFIQDKCTIANITNQAIKDLNEQRGKQSDFINGSKQLKAAFAHSGFDQKFFDNVMTTGQI